MSVKNCDHKTFMAIYDDDTNTTCPACKIKTEMSSLAGEIKAFVGKCNELGLIKEDEEEK